MLRRYTNSALTSRLGAALRPARGLRSVPLHFNALAVTSARHLCTASPPSQLSPTEALQSLHQACEKELIEEQASEHTELPAPPGWTYHHMPGSGYFTLTRESPFMMEVFCRIEDPKPEVLSEGESVGTKGLTFIVRVTRNQKTCEMSCMAAESELEIQNFRVFSDVRTREDFLKSEAYFNSQLSYEGPDLAHMDEGFAQSLFGFMESVGINDELAIYISKRVEITEQQEYERWLSELKQFTQS